VYKIVTFHAFPRKPLSQWMDSDQNCCKVLIVRGRNIPTLIDKVNCH